MKTNQQYLDEVHDVIDSANRVHATSFDQEYCFDSIVDEGYARIAIKVSMTIDNVETTIRDELRRICSFLRCTPLIVGEKTRKRPLHDGVVHTRGSIPAITLETLRQLLEEKKLPFIIAKKGGIYAIVNGDKLKEIREAQNYSRGSIAEELGLSRRAVYEYERGTMNPTIEVALRLEKILGKQFIQPFDLLEVDATKEVPNFFSQYTGKETKLAKTTLEVLSRLGLQSTLTHDSPFDILTSLRQRVLLSYLKQRLEQLNEDRLSFLAKLSEVLNEEPTIIASDDPSVESINGIPVVYIKELLAMEKPREFIALIRSRRGA
ncbi:MAG: transcriptional regulator [Candidatus Odinarchaeota archaeon]